MNNLDNDTITLVSLESNHIEINTKAAKRSNLISGFINDFPNADIRLNKIKYSTLKKIAEYLEHYINSEPKEITQPLPKKDFKDCVDPWDYEYINLPSDTILEIMLAANFMDIKPLLELTCAKIASIIKGKNTKEIQNILNMESDSNDGEESIYNNESDGTEDDDL